ncbi:MAG: ATP-binding protein [Planctomycetes bacterium]|nr:ATP-binding protein [Planctomycetota bacterium]
MDPGHRDSDFVPRALEPALRQAVQDFPVVVLTGPRQSGKTTLLKHLFSATHRYVSLDVPDVRAVAVSDPRSFLALHGPPVIFDEIQYAPELLAYIKAAVDERRRERGQFLLTGSQNLLLSQHVSETLAGRASMLVLPPLALREIRRTPRQPLPWEQKVKPSASGDGMFEIVWRYMLRGGYPELWAEPDREARPWDASYVQTYLERDVRSLRQVGDLTLFQSFLRALAARHGQLFNASEIARELGLAGNTIKAWLSVLETSYQVTILRPYYRNAGKRLVKAPKVYFTDSGILCYLVGIQTREQALGSPLGGPLFEGTVLGELIKAQVSRGQEARVYFWRTAAGAEVDFVVEHAGRCIPIEAKLSSTPRPRMASGIEAFARDFPESEKGYVVHTGDMILPLGEHALGLPLHLL